MNNIDIKIKRKGNNEICSLNSYKLKNDTDVIFITYSGLESTGIVKHCFTTRLGGVSEGEFATMNLSYTRGDSEEAVDENYERIAELLGCERSNIVCSQQTHTTNVVQVTKAGESYKDVDGLITNKPDIVLATFYADCVPLYIVDPVNNAIGLSHSGWRGTVNRMGKVTLDAMAEAYGTKPEKVKVAIGPSICQDCYEVSEDVALEFINSFPQNAEFAREFLEKYNDETDISDENIKKCLCYKKTNGKYQLNLWYANYHVFREAGVAACNIEVPDLCTCCNPTLLFSHRASKGKRGNLGAFLGLK